YSSHYSLNSQCSIVPTVLARVQHRSIDGIRCFYLSVGVFVSRSSINFVQLNMLFIGLMPVFQLLNTAFFMLNAIYAFIPNFGIVCAIVLYEGLIGGASYVNTFHHIHKKIDPEVRSFALSTVSLADSVGILLAALTSIPIHNAICAMQWYR
ncbi:CLN3 protein, partial [Ostertagia ostertagi]